MVGVIRESALETRPNSEAPVPYGSTSLTMLSLFVEEQFFLVCYKLKKELEL